MQKAFIAIALALTLACAIAGPTATNWVKAPAKVLQDTDSNFTNTSTLTLGGLSSSDVSVLAYNAATNTSTNTSDYKWNVFTKTINAKSLEGSSNTSYNFASPMISVLAYGYAMGFDSVNDTTTNNIPQLFLFQTKLGGAVVPRIQISTNNNASYNPGLIGSGSNSKYLTFFIRYNDKVNYTSISVGGSSMGKEFTLISGNTVNSVSVAWGEALSSTQAMVSYYAGDPLNVVVVDFSSGTTINSAAVAGKWDKTVTSCASYATDKKYYGVWCRNTTGDMTTVYVSANTTNTLDVLFSYNRTVTKESVSSVQAYAGYLTFFFTNSTTSNATVLSYENWDVSAGKIVGNRTTYLTYDPATSVYSAYRIPMAGMYGLVCDRNGTVKTNIQVGQIMGASSLSTVFGFIMTIVAGLFLF